MGFSYLLGSKKRKKAEKCYEIRQMLVSGALDRTKKIRKTAADIFAKSGPEKPWKNRGGNQIVSGFFHDFPVASRLWPGLGGACVA